MNYHIWVRNQELNLPDPVPVDTLNEVVIEGKKASTSLLQRRLRIGYGRAARLMEEMEEQGIIGQADGARPREVLVSSLEQVFGGPSDPDEAEVFSQDDTKA